MTRTGADRSPGDLPTGEQHRLGRGTVTATVTELGAALRALRVDGVALVPEYPEDAPPPGASGVVLVPWPNRVAGATWTLDGRPQRLDVTEPSTGNASHGLLRNSGYAVAERTEDAVTLTATVFPQHGYPFLLRTAVRYALADDGVEVTHTIRNGSGAPAPVAVGAHPYVTVGEAAMSALSVTVEATTYEEVDAHGIPVATHPVDGSAFDLRGGRRLGGVELDTAYTGLAVVDGRHRHRVTGPDGTGLEVWADPDFGYVQVFTSHVYVGADGRTVDALAVEPMTAPADALNRGTGLRWLAPGEEWTLAWGIRRLADPSADPSGTSPAAVVG